MGVDSRTDIIKYPSTMHTGPVSVTDSRWHIRELSMSNLGKEVVKLTSDVPSERRYFKSQNRFQGGCLILALNNALGETVITLPDLLARVKSQRAPGKRVPLPEKKGKLLSFHLLVEAVNLKRIQLTKIGYLRTPEDKFSFLLSTSHGRYMVLTNVVAKTQKRGTHDLDARNEQHWVAVSADEGLVIDSLARSCGPQQRTETTLRRATRQGIVKIYSVTRLSTAAK